MSVLTDGPSFQGDDACLVAARAAVTLPCLRKDFLVDPWQVAESRALGADCILIILAMIDDALAAELLAEARRLGMDALIETHDEAEMARACMLGGDLVGINNRSLRTFEVDLAVTERLAPLAPPEALLVAESGLFTPEDVARVTAEQGRLDVLVNSAWGGYERFTDGTPFNPGPFWATGPGRWRWSSFRNRPRRARRAAGPASPPPLSRAADAPRSPKRPMTRANCR